MSIEVIRSFLLWCTVINYGILLIWFLFFALAHGWIQGIHGRWFHFSNDQFDAIHNAGMAIFKIEIILLNLVRLNPAVVFNCWQTLRCPIFLRHVDYFKRVGRFGWEY